MQNPVFRAPPPMAVPREEELLVSAAVLNHVQRQALWAYIQINDPPMYAFLTDPVIQDAKNRLHGTVQFPFEIVRAALGEPIATALIEASVQHRDALFDQQQAVIHEIEARKTAPPKPKHRHAA